MRTVIAVSLVFLAAMVGSVFYFFKMTRNNMANPKQEIPSVKLKIGDSITRVQSQSTYRFNIKNLDDRHPISISTPVIFEYTHPEQGFVLPPAQFLWLTIYAEHVVDVQVSPHLEYLSLHEANSLLNTLAATFNHSGWKKDTSEYASMDELITEFTDPDAGSEHAVTVQKWRGGGDEIHINLRRHWKGEESLPQLTGDRVDFFTVTIFIDNNSVYRRYDKSVKEKRRNEERNGNMSS